MVFQNRQMRSAGWFATALLLAATPGARAELPPLSLTLVKDLNTTPAPRSSLPDAFLAADGKAYFAASTPATGRELYVSDGSEAGTRLLADIFPGVGSSEPLAIGVVNGRVILRAGMDPPTRQFWSVPTGGGAPRQLTAESWTGDYTVPSPRVLATAGGRLLFRIAYESGVWSTDGSAAGTVHLVAASGFPVADTLAACSMDGFAVLAGSSGSGLQLARTDGTVAGTQTLTALPPSGSAMAVRAAGHCYLLLSKAGGGWSLWASDGTPAGTAELSVDNGASAYTLVGTGNAVYFSDRNFSQNRVRVLRSSVAAPQPQLVKEFIGSGHRIDAIQTVGDALLFFHGLGSNPTDTLYLSDGTSAGTRSVFPLEPGQSFRTTSLYPVPGGVVFNAWDELKRLDFATGAVTQGPDPNVFLLDDSVLLGGQRLGRGRDAQTGDELWRSDGTRAGSSRVADILAATADGMLDDGWQPGRASSVLVGDVLVFTNASDPTDELPLRARIWRSDGTAAGTYALLRSAYGEGSTAAIARLGDGLIFAAGGWSFVPYEIHRTDATLSMATLLSGGIAAPVAMQPSADGDAVLFTCGASLSTTTLCRVNASGTVTVAGPSGVDFTGFRPIGDIAGVALLQRSEAGEIWRSDGTVPGTFPLSSRQVPYGSIPSAVFGGSLYFAACDDSGCALMASDGTVAGTRTVFGFQSAGLIGLAALPDRIVFSLQYASRVELWASDGSSGDTQRLIEVDGFRSTPIVVAGGNAHLAAFGALDAVGGYVVSDGTVAGTWQPPLPASFVAYDTGMAALGDIAVVFGCYSPGSGAELCAADAQGLNARALPETSPGSVGLWPFVIRANANGAYVVADDGVHGKELWYLRRLTDAVFAHGFQ
jgi:ELWxxDGT repeat protein